MSTTKNVAGYIRVSTEKQKEENSHVRQKDLIKDWIERNLDYDNIILYEDIAISGQSKQREEYQKLMNNLQNIDYVVVRELSRFGRDHLKILQDIEELNDYDVEFVSLKEDFNTDSPMGEAMFKLISILNELQANLARQRTKEMIERRKEQGLSVGRPKKLSDKEIDKVLEWREKGLSYQDITILVKEQFGVDVGKKTIYRYVKEFDEG